MTARSGHACRTNLETAVCRELSRQAATHEHRSLRFRVRDAHGDEGQYAPAVVARRGAILFLVEPIASARARVLRELPAFLEQHSAEIVLVVVTPRALVHRIPKETYDEIYAGSEIPRMVARIREQDPDGIVRPFEKPHSAGVRDTAK